MAYLGDAVAAYGVDDDVDLGDEVSEGRRVARIDDARGDLLRLESFRRRGGPSSPNDLVPCTDKGQRDSDGGTYVSSDSHGGG